MPNAIKLQEREALVLVNEKEEFSDEEILEKMNELKKKIKNHEKESIDSQPIDNESIDSKVVEEEEPKEIKVKAKEIETLDDVRRQIENYQLEIAELLNEKKRYIATIQLKIDTLQSKINELYKRMDEVDDGKA